MKQNAYTRITPQMAANIRLRLAADWRTMDSKRRTIIIRHLFFITRLNRWPWVKDLVWKHLAWDFAQLTNREVREHKDSLARELYDRRRACLICHKPISMADLLSQTPCSFCGQVNRSDLLPPDQAQVLLHDLKKRRRKLRLPESKK